LKNRENKAAEERRKKAIAESKSEMAELKQMVEKLAGAVEKRGRSRRRMYRLASDKSKDVW